MFLIFVFPYYYQIISANSQCILYDLYYNIAHVLTCPMYTQYIYNKMPAGLLIICKCIWERTKTPYLSLKGHTTNLKVFRLKLSKAYFLFGYVVLPLLLGQLKCESGYFQCWRNIKTSLKNYLHKKWRNHSLWVSPAPLPLLIGPCSFQ